MKRTIKAILGYTLTLGGFVGMFTMTDAKWQLLWTLGAGFVCLLGCQLLAKSGVIKDTDNA